jgi:hypothetical protein
MSDDEWDAVVEGNNFNLSLIGTYIESIKELRDEIDERDSMIRSLTVENEMLRAEVAQLQANPLHLVDPEKLYHAENVIKRAFGRPFEQDHPTFWRPPDGAA